MKGVLNIPSQLTEDEEILMKKLASLQEKKKQYLEAKANKEQKAAQKIAIKRASTDTQHSTDDAKETARKLIKSGAIKLETECKERGFKRSLSRKDDHHLYKKPPALSPLFTSESNPFFAKSPLASASSSASSTYSPSLDSSSMHSPNASPSITTQQHNKFHFNYSTTTTHRQYSHPYQHQQLSPSKLNTFSLHVKGDKEINEEYIRNAFISNVTDLQIASVDMKKNYAFVAVDSKQSAENAIKILNDQIINNVKLSVSHARPRQNTFIKRPFLHHSNSHTDNNVVKNHNSQNSTSNAQNWSDIAQSSSTATYSATKQSRNVVSYDDDPALFN